MAGHGERGAVVPAACFNHFPYSPSIRTIRPNPSKVRGRFWSTFDAFTDAELEAGCADIAAEHSGGGGVLEFEDRLLFITAQAQA